MTSGSTSPGDINFPLSRARLPRLEVLAAAPSTNVLLLEEAVGDPEALAWPDASALLTLNQTAGRGRLGRAWQAPPDTALALSLLLRMPASVPASDRASQSAAQPGTPPATQPALPLASYPWLGLLAGAAMTDAVAALLPEPQRVSLKWPNDVLIGEQKICGILTELAADGRSLVLGLGVNLTMSTEQLPVHTATSLALSGAVVGEGGATELADALVSGFLRGFLPAREQFVAAGGNALVSGTRTFVFARCGTLGRRVTVTRDGLPPLEGVAESLDAAGRIQIRLAKDDTLIAVTTGDVQHLRHAPA